MRHPRCNAVDAEEESFSLIEDADECTSAIEYFTKMPLSTVSSPYTFFLALL